MGFVNCGPHHIDRLFLPYLEKKLIDFFLCAKGTKTEWNSEPLKILKILKVLSGNWTYDFKKDRKNIFYDKILKF